MRWITQCLSSSAKIGLLLLILSIIAGFALWPKNEKPNIILISLDTLRADHFNAEHMPKTYTWARERGTIYTNAHSPATWTLPAHLSIFTGFMPSEHGAQDVNAKLPETIPSLAEKMEKGGYHTYAATSGVILLPGRGFRGFSVFRNVPLVGLIDNGEAFDYALDMLQEARPPYFLFVHTIMTHTCQYVPNVPTSIDGMLAALRNMPDEEKLKRYRARVALCDNRLLKFLDKLPKDACVIITSDHGEGFGEPCADGKSYYHGQKPTPDQTHVPLFVSGSAGIEDGLVSTIALYDFILRQEPLKPQSTILCDYAHYLDSSNPLRATITARGRTFESISPATSASYTLSEGEKEQLSSLGYLE